MGTKIPEKEAQLKWFFDEIAPKLNWRTFFASAKARGIQIDFHDFISNRYIIAISSFEDPSKDNLPQGEIKIVIKKIENKEETIVYTYCTESPEIVGKVFPLVKQAAKNDITAEVDMANNLFGQIKQYTDNLCK